MTRFIVLISILSALYACGGGEDEVKKKPEPARRDQAN